ncbi:FG-GAP repeat protein, partial [Rubripirellula amarantea]|nr:FG-GAP repeat protein [Rubripirellula amarantea]
GRSVDIDGDTIVVGASTANTFGPASGAAYVFNQDEFGVWTEAKKLTGSTQDAGDRFGQSVSIDNSTVAVGAFRHDGEGNDSGSVYIFKRNRFGAENWGELKAITAPDASAGDQFGYSVSVDGTTVAVGAPLDDTGGTNQLGSVYVLSQNEGGANNWGQVAKLLADDGVTGDRFGSAVAFDGNRLVAGSPQADGGGSNSGHAYLFEKTRGLWDQTRVFVNDEVTTADQYGIAVGLSGDVAVIGSWLDNRPANNSGGAYVFDLQTDNATVTITVTSTPSELPLTQGTPELASISSETAEPMKLVESRRTQFSSTVPLASPRDRVFAAGLIDRSDDELETYLDDIVGGHLMTAI